MEGGHDNYDYQHANHLNQPSNELEDERELQSSTPYQDFQLDSAFNSINSTSNLLQQHRLQLNSLHRSAEVARFQWLNNSSYSQPSESSSTSTSSTSSTSPSSLSQSQFQSDFNVWNRLLSDIGIGAALPSNEEEEEPQPTTTDSTSSFSILSSTSPSPFNPNARVLPHPIWARRYPGSAGEWLRAELGRRSITSTTTSNTSTQTQPQPTSRQSLTTRDINFNPFRSSPRWGPGGAVGRNEPLVFPSLDPERRSNRDGIEVSNTTGFQAGFLPWRSGSSRLSRESDSINGEINLDSPLQPQVLPQSSTDRQVATPTFSTSNSDARNRAREMVAELARSRRERAVQRAEERRRENPSSSATGGRSRATVGANTFLDRLRRLDGLIQDSEEDQGQSNQTQNQDPNGEGHLSSSSSSSFPSEANTEEVSPILGPQDLFPWYGPTLPSSDGSSSSEVNVRTSTSTQTPVSIEEPTSPSTLFSRLTLSDPREVDESNLNSTYSSNNRTFDPDGDFEDPQPTTSSAISNPTTSNWTSLTSSNILDRSGWYSAARARMQRAQETNRNNRRISNPYSGDVASVEMTEALRSPPVTMVYLSDSEEEDRIGPAERASIAQRARDRERRIGMIREAQRMGREINNQAQDPDQFDPDGDQESLPPIRFIQNSRGLSSTATLSSAMETLTSSFRPRSTADETESRLQRLRNRTVLVMSDEIQVGDGEEEGDENDGETTLGRRVNGGGNENGPRQGAEGWTLVQPLALENQRRSSSPTRASADEGSQNVTAWSRWSRPSPGDDPTPEITYTISPQEGPSATESSLLNQRRMSASPDQMEADEGILGTIGSSSAEITPIRERRNPINSSSAPSLDLRSIRAPRRLASLTESDLPASRSTVLRSDSSSNSTSNAISPLEIIPDPTNRSGAPSPVSPEDESINDLSRSPRPIPSFSSPIRRAEWMSTASSRLSMESPTQPSEEPHPTRRDVGGASWEEHRERIASQAMASMNNNETWMGSEAERAFLRELENDEEEVVEEDHSSNPPPPPVVEVAPVLPSTSTPVDFSARAARTSQLLDSLADVRASLSALNLAASSRLDSTVEVEGRETSIEANEARNQTSPESQQARLPNSLNSLVPASTSRLTRRASYSTFPDTSAVSASTPSIPHSQDDTSPLVLASTPAEATTTKALCDALDGFARPSAITAMVEIILRRFAFSSTDSSNSSQPTSDDEVHALRFGVWESIGLDGKEKLATKKVLANDENLLSTKKSSNVDLILRFQAAVPPSVAGASSSRTSSSRLREVDGSNVPLLDSDGSPNVEPLSILETLSSAERQNQVRAEDREWRRARRSIISGSSSRHSEMRSALGLPPSSPMITSEEGEELLRQVVPTLAAQGSERQQNRFATQSFTQPQLDVLRRISAARTGTSREERFSALSSLTQDEIGVLRALVASRILLLSNQNQEEAPAQTSRERSQGEESNPTRLADILKPDEELPFTPSQRELISSLLRSCKSAARSSALSESLLLRLIASRTECFRSLILSRLDEIAPEDKATSIFTMTKMIFKNSKNSGRKAVREGLVFSSLDPISADQLQEYDEFNEMDLRCLARERKVRIAGLEKEVSVVIDEDQETKDFGDPFAMSRRIEAAEQRWKSETSSRATQIPESCLTPIGFFKIDPESNSSTLEFGQGVSGRYLAVKLLRNGSGNESGEGMELQYVGMMGWEGLRTSGSGEWSR